MKTRHPQTHTAFTLIELLTVIAIMAVLMGLLFPVIAGVKENTRKTQAGNDVTQIVTAVKAYYTEYGKFPDMTLGSGSQAGGLPEDQWVGYKDAEDTDGNPNSALFNTLRAIDKEPNDKHRLNPRKVVFFEGRSVANPDAPRAGFADKKSGGGSSGGSDAKIEGCYFDPWGKQYLVMIDTNYDNRLDMGQFYSDFSSDDDKPRTGVAAVSKGKDEELGDARKHKGRYRDGKEKSDDVVSWQ